VTRRIVALIEGRDLGKGWVEPVVAEATSTMQNAGVDPFIEKVAERCGSIIERRREATSARERSSMGGAPLPPSDDEVKAWFALESAMLSGELIEKELENAGVRMCEPSGKGRREISFRVPEDAFPRTKGRRGCWAGAGASRCWW
jgi:hypothetical protein